MSVKVIFCKWGNDKEIANEIGDCYILTPDNWDDYKYKTTFKVNLYKNGEQYGEYSRKILFQDKEIKNSSEFLEKILSKNKYIDIKQLSQNYKFISLGSEYEELKKIFIEKDDYIEILKVLNDVIYLENKAPDSSLRTELLLIKEYEAFETSLTRDQYSKKMLQEGKALLFGEILNENRFNFEFNFQLNEKNYKYKFDFNKKEDLPHRINVLIGKNGSGKSQTLLALSEYLLNNKKFRSRVAKELHPNFLYHLLLFAYNPHEKFIISRDFKKYDIEYKYVGYRRYKSIMDIEQKLLMESPDLYKLFVNFKDDDIMELSEKILKADIEDERNKNDEEKDELINSSFESNPNKEELSKIFKDNWEILIDTITQDMMDKNILNETLYKSFSEIYKKDKNNYDNFIQISDISYIEKIFSYIQKVFECDAIGLKFIKDENIAKYQQLDFNISNGYLLVENELNKNKYARNIDFEDFESKLYFFNKNQLIPSLSSGQETFINLIINILALIKPNSLILIDEPENTLHPNIEIDFISILQDILSDKDFDSFAIIATHSPTIVREVPENFVRVIKFDGSGQPLIDSPSIKTFGADIGTITNYVFEDIFKEDKPFEKWFHSEKSKYGLFEDFEKKYKDYLNYDFLLYCKNAWDI
jgi:predicted ATPase